MKRFFLSTLALLLTTISWAQPKKVSWSYAVKEIAPMTYEVKITATPPPGWHIYSQFTPEGGPVPTTFTFNKNALVTLDGKVKETGKTKKYFDDNFKVNVVYFERDAVFTQVVKLKGKVKTNLSGEVESMICDDHTCMPPSTHAFSIPLQ